MTKLIKFTIACALSLAITVSCTTPNDPDHRPDPLATPTGLVQTDVTATAATLGWDSVEGATRYKVRINEEEPVTIALNSYAARLAPQTEYRWAVQAFNGEVESEWSAEATFSTPAATLAVPTGLGVVDVTDKRATLVWDAVDWAKGYEVKMGDAEPVAVEEARHFLIGLSALTKYSWTVRAVDGENKGEWARNATFTTKPTQFIEAVIDNYYGSLTGSGTTNMIVSFHSYNGEFDVTGYDLELDLVTMAIPDGSDVRYLEIPAGTYPFTHDGSPGKVLPGVHTQLHYYDKGYHEWRKGVIGGTLVIEGDRSDYRMTFEVRLEGGETFFAEWNGALSLRNPHYEVPVGDRDFGTFEGITQFEYFRGAYAQADAWMVSAYDGGVWVENGQFKGNGWIARLQIHTSPGSGEPMPDGIYTIERGGQPWTVLANNGSNGLEIVPIEYSTMINEEAVYVVSGTMKSIWSQSAGKYTLEIEGTSSRGEAIKLNIKGYEPTTIL